LSSRNQTIAITCMSDVAHSAEESKDGRDSGGRSISGEVIEGYCLK
jgi:hypothetical protein